jgi:hypothetical protein
MHSELSIPREFIGIPKLRHEAKGSLQNMNSHLKEGAVSIDEASLLDVKTT